MNRWARRRTLAEEHHWRAQTAGQPALANSVVFRASGQDLTTWGTYTEMVGRFTEPALLALAALAMRSRIKR